MTSPLPQTSPLQQRTAIAQQRTAIAIEDSLRVQVTFYNEYNQYVSEVWYTVDDSLKMGEDISTWILNGGVPA